MTYATPPLWQITDEAIGVLDRELAGHEPERGAALLAPAGSRLVVEVVVDPVAGESASYWHSAMLKELLNERLAAAPLLRYVGTAHSHPGGMAWPSVPDAGAFEASVGASGLEAGLFPIVVDQPRDVLHLPRRCGDQHLLELPGGTLAPYTWRTTHGLDACRLAVLPLRGSIEAALDRLGAEVALVAGATQSVAGVGTSWLLVPLTDACGEVGGPAVELLVPQSYPESAPLIRSEPGGFVSPSWDLAVPLTERLAAAIRSELEKVSAPEARAGVRARLAHHIPDDSAKKVAILGCGSVGSTVAELLARGGVESFALVDPDGVSAANLSRGVYTADQVGVAKVQALGDRLRAIAPDVRVATYADALGGDAAEVVADVDLAVLATDDPAAEAWHSHVLYDAGIPYVSAKLFARADAGEIALVVPEEDTACLACATGMTHGQRERGAADYGTGRLDGEPALGSDVAAVAARAAKVALAVLHRGVPGPLSEWVGPLLAAQRTLNLSTAVDGWGIFSQVAVAPMDGPFASLWVKTAPRPECAVCGPDRVPPQSPLDAVVLPDVLPDVLDGLTDPSGGESSTQLAGSVGTDDAGVTLTERN